MGLLRSLPLCLFFVSFLPAAIAIPPDPLLFFKPLKQAPPPQGNADGGALRLASYKACQSYLGRVLAARAAGTGLLLRARPEDAFRDPDLEYTHIEHYRDLLVKRVGPDQEETWVSLRPSLPKVAREKVGLRSNCWNATLNWHDPSVGLYLTFEETMIQYLTGNDATYRELTREEPLELGDVVALFSRSGLLHTAIYLNPEFVWNKSGSRDERPFSFQRIDDVADQHLRGEPDPAIRFFRYRGQPK